MILLSFTDVPFYLYLIGLYRCYLIRTDHLLLRDKLKSFFHKWKKYTSTLISLFNFYTNHHYVLIYTSVLQIRHQTHSFTHLKIIGNIELSVYKMKKR